LHPSVASAVGTKPFSGVGFPNGDVFEFDRATFESLCRAWQSGDAEMLARARQNATLAQERSMEAA
jgi:hypothetical protein